MKKLLFVLAASACMMLAAQTAHAQLYFGGSIGFTRTSMTDGDTTTKVSGSSFKIAPEVGFQLNDKMAVGGTVTIQQGLPYMGAFDLNDIKGFMTAAAGTYSDLGTAGDGGQRYNGFRVAPYFRYYLFDTKRFDLFVDAVVAYGNFKSQTKTDSGWHTDEGSKLNLFELGARPGFRLKFDKFAVVGRLGSLGFQSLKLADTANTGATRFGFDLDTANILLSFTISL